MVRAADCQIAYFRNADRKRFFWLTSNALMCFCQDALLSTLGVRGSMKVLEIGCGEGANLHVFKKSGARLFGIDLFEQKLSFAGQHNPHAYFAAADAAALPFADNSFNLVFCKDVLHHIEHKAAVINEMVRVCRPSGRVVLIEANGSHPLWRLFGTIVSAERGVKENSMRSLSGLLNACRADHQSTVGRYIFVPLACMLLTHYKFGWGNLGNKSIFLRLCMALSAAVKRCLSERLYPYISVSAVKS